MKPSCLEYKSGDETDDASVAPRWIAWPETLSWLRGVAVVTPRHGWCLQQPVVAVSSLETDLSMCDRSTPTATTELQLLQNAGRPISRQGAVEGTLQLLVRRWLVPPVPPCREATCSQAARHRRVSSLIRYDNKLNNALNVFLCARMRCINLLLPLFDVWQICTGKLAARLPA